MKNKLKICMATVMAGVLSVGVTANFKVKANPDVIKFSKEIVALTPHSGEEISIVHSGIEGVLNLSRLTVDGVGKYYYFRPEMQIWNDSSTIYYDTSEKIRDFYDLCDDFAPINNELTWSYDAGAESYTVILALDKGFNNVVFSKTVEGCSINLGNVLYSDTDYYWQVIANTGDGEVRSEIFEFSTKDGTRTVDIDGVSNSRDVGGYQTPYGKTVQGVLYRTARLDDVTEEGRKALEELGIKTDLDLRGVGEGLENPLGINYAHATAAPIYTNGINTQEGKDSIKIIFQTLANQDNYPIVLHCTVGRDRTGTAIALLNAMLGVDEQTIVNEYMLSVFGAVSSINKGSDALITNINSLITYIKTFEGDTLEEKAINLLLDTGVTTDEIQAIRDVMYGEVKVYDNTVESGVNYDGMHLVSFKAYGHAVETLAVKDGITIQAPFEIGEDYVWMANGEVFDFSKPITNSVEVKAIKRQVITVTVNVDGEEREIEAQVGDSIDLSQFEKDGFVCRVLDEEGSIITSLTVAKNCVISIIYIKI